MSKYDKERYDWYKANGWCVRCGNARSVKGKTMCEVCLLKGAEDSAKYREAHPEHGRYRGDYRKKLRADRKEKGLCIYCGRFVAPTSTTLCAECLSKQRRRERLRKNPSGIPRSERRHYGLCYRCGEKVEIFGDALCFKCREMSIRNLRNDEEASESRLEHRKAVKQEIREAFAK